MKSTTAIRIADQVLQNSDLFTKKDEQQELEDVKKNDPLSSQIWRMYTKAKDNLPNGSRLENLTWRMMALSLKKDQGPSSEQLDLKHANPEPEVASKSPPMIQDAHVIIDYTDENQQLFFLENTEPPLSIMNNYSMSTNTAEFTSLQDIFDMPYTDDNVMMYNQPITQQNMSSTDQQRRQSSIKSTSSDEKEKRKNQNPKNGLTKCKNCSTKNTPLWRRDPSGNPLCNACGLFLKLHGVVRPLSLKTDVIKKRNRSNNPPSKSLPTNNNITTTPSKSINKRRRYSTKQKNDQLLGTSLPIMPSSPSSFYFSPASLTPPPALGHSSSTSSLVSLNPSPPQQQQDNSIYSIFDEMGIYLPTPADNNMANTTDDLLYSNNSYFY